MIDNQMHPGQPTALEAEWYYCGIPSTPRLIARTGVAQFELRKGDTDPSPFKVICRVGAHEIAQLWNHGTLSSLIMDALSSIEWNTIDVVRIGYAKGDHFPVTLLVSVTPDSTGWPEGQAAVDRCEKVLHSQHLSDVNVEIKEGVVFSLSDHQTAPPEAPRLLTVDDVEPHELYMHTLGPLTELASTEISLLNQPTTGGTKGCYLRDRDNGHIYALTCAHVVMPDQSSTAALSDCPVIQASEETMRFGALDLPPELRPIWEQFTRSEHRIIGHVACAPPVCAVGSGLGARMRDWALIQLHPDKHRTPLNELRNRVWTESNFGRQVRMLLDREIDPARRNKYPELGHVAGKDNFSMQLTGVIPDETLRRAPQEVEARDEEEDALVVMKRGALGLFTAGVANNVRSVIRRHPALGGAETTCMELCIVLQKDWKCDWCPNFCARGDSGAIIFDPHGRVVGMVTSGSGLLDYISNVDITYASTMDWILEDAKNFGYNLELV